MKKHLLLLIISFSICFHVGHAQEIVLSQSGNGYWFSLNPAPKPPIRPAGGKETPKWLYFWEFGDGHYSEEISPKHTYAATGNYTVTVYLTAAYSLDHQKKISQTVNIRSAGQTPSNPSYPGLSNSSSIRITSNNNELVARDELQLVIHYRPPPGYQSGKVVLAFNEKDSRKKSFRLVSARPYYGEKEEADIYEDETVYENSSYVSFLESQAGNFQNVHAWSYKNLPSNSTARLFVTLKVETPRIGQEIAINAFLIPDQGPLRTSGTSTTKTMIILASHDPNRITVIPRTIELPVPSDTAFKYRVFFQNRGEGLANNVNVRVNIPEMLDTDGLEVLSYRIAGDSLKRCKDITNSRESCFTYEVGEKFVDFQFRNVVLSGSQGSNIFENQLTKGEIEFRIPPKLVQKEETFVVPVDEDVLTRASIKFDTEDDTIYTNQIDTRFRIRTWGIKAGFNGGRTLSELTSSPKGLSNIILSVSFADNPVHQGYAWESEVAYSSYRYTQTKTQYYIDESDPLTVNTLSSKLSLTLFYADILAQSRFHLNDYVGFGFGGGFATLIAGIGEYDSITYNGARVTPNDVKVKNGLLFIGQDYSQIDFFPLDNDLEPDIQNNPGSFLATIFFAEIGVGKVNRGPMAGFRYGTRFQNGLFETSFVRQNFLQFFVQWKF